MLRLARWLPLVAFATGCASTGEFEQAEYPPAPPPPVVAPAAPVGEPPQQFEDTDPAALTDFRQPLDPYGVWVDDATYGTVWIPSEAVVGSDFAPYVSHGHWALDPQERWVWISDFDPQFGWVTFHYGRWVWIEDRGWAWIPGRQWAPAWVVWRTGDPGYDYVGWAPAPPYFYWRSRVVFWFDTYPRAPYVFCHTRHVFHEHVYAHVVPASHVQGVARGTYPYQGGIHAGAPTEHVLAHPQPGPSVKSGHIPQTSWPSGRVALDSRQASFASPRSLGRSTTTAPRTSRSLGFSDGPERAPGQSPTVTHSAPHTTRAPSATPRPSGSGFSPPTHSTSRAAPPPSRSVPPPSHSVPTHAPSRGSAPAPHFSPPARSAPAPSHAPAPSRSSGSKGGGRRGR